MKADVLIRRAEKLFAKAAALSERARQLGVQEHTPH
jgi:hypothetical protein